MADVENNIHERFMTEALNLAIDGAARGDCGPFGAVVVHAGRVVGRGFNRVVVSRDPSAHAEIIAIREACRTLETFTLEGCDLYTSCEPCPMCLGAAYWARLERIFFGASGEDAATAGFDDTFLYAEFAKSRVDRTLPVVKLSSETNLVPFRVWAENPDKIPY